MRPGIPQRAKAVRSVATVSDAGTFIHRPEGKNGGQEHGAGVFIDDPQPGDLGRGGQADLLGGVHLPDVVGPQAALSRRGGRLGLRRSRQAVMSEPALQRADRGDGPGGEIPQQQTADQGGAPA
jgi:hypothetical protein